MAKQTAERNLGGKRVLVVGLARQGTALTRYLVSVGAKVTVTDIRPASELGQAVTALGEMPVRLVLGDHPLSLLDGTDLVCLSGGVPADGPLAVAARERGIPLANDALLTLERRPARAMGVTGSSGKTTTTTLVGLILEEAGIKTHVGGNIGTPLIDRLHHMKADDWTVMELSSFQLELFDRSPPVAAVTNITPNHLDRHGTMARYCTAKANILRWQRTGDVCLLGADSEITGRWLRSGWVDVPAAEGPLPSRAGAKRGWYGYPIRAERMGVSLRDEIAVGAFLRRDELVTRLPGHREHSVCRRDDVLLRGMHNLANLLTAFCLAGVAGAPHASMAHVARTFTGVEHRLEEVRTIDGVLWVNDSIATSPERAVAAIRSFDQPTILLAGGRDKNLPWSEFAREVLGRVKELVLFGEAAQLISEAVMKCYSEAADTLPLAPSLPPITGCGDLEEAVAAAERLSESGDVVLLAPGGTSFDSYVDYAARGDHFRTLVLEIEE
jgi:UDP-N-acetylmuramoylalanine--D-glutamate ligase